MANVQIDDGNFTRISNEILENVAKAKLNGTQYAIVLTIWRNTYGYQKTEGDFSLGYLANETGLDRMQIRRELVRLVDRKILIVVKEATRTTPQTLKFNKDYDRWVLAKTLTGSTKPSVSKSLSGVSEKANSLGVSEKDNTPVSEKAYTGVSELANQIKKEIKERDKERPPIIPQDEKCPYVEIVNQFHINCPSLPRVRDITDGRKKDMRSRWKKT